MTWLLYHGMSMKEYFPPRKIIKKRELWNKDKWEKYVKNEKKNGVRKRVQRTNSQQQKKRE